MAGAKEKKCSLCGEIKLLENFYPSSRDGYSAECKSCHTLRVGKWFRENKGAGKQGHRRYYLAHREQQIQKAKEQNRSLRKQALGAYGGAICRCCGETEESFLAIDHIGGNGNQQKRNEGIVSGTGLYRWLKKNDYPFGFQVLCYNCNVGRYRNGGTCPHARIKV